VSAGPTEPIDGQADPSVLDRRDAFLLVGAGPMGLAHARALEAAAIPFDWIEADEGPGGLWRHAGYAGMTTLTPKHALAFSDAPMPRGWPLFPCPEHMTAYLAHVLERSGLGARLTCGVKLVEAEPDQEHWRVRFEDGRRRLYKGLILCTGRHWQPSIPSFPGRFTGEVVHSKYVTHPDQLAGRRILVVGEGASAAETACLAARDLLTRPPENPSLSNPLDPQAGLRENAPPACLWSVRRAPNLLPKTMFGRATADRYAKGAPSALARMRLAVGRAGAIGAQSSLGLDPPHSDFLRHNPVLSDEIADHLRQGRIRVVPAVKRFDGNVVRFADGSEAAADTLVLATGYTPSFPFLPMGAFAVRARRIEALYGVIARDYRHLYAPGMQSGIGALGPTAEAQANLVVAAIGVQDAIPGPLGRFLERRWFSFGSNPHSPASLRSAAGGLRLLREVIGLKLMPTGHPGSAEPPKASPGEEAREAGPDRPMTVY